MEETNSIPGTVPPPVDFGGMVEMLAGLVLVVLLILGLAWLYRKVAVNSGGFGGIIRVQSAMSLGNRDRIALIAVGEKQMLLGISPGRISTLHVFEEPVELTQRETTPGREGVPDSDFAARLRRLVSEGGSHA